MIIFSCLVIFNLFVKLTSCNSYYTHKRIGEKCVLKNQTEGICRPKNACTTYEDNKGGRQPCGFTRVDEKLFCCPRTTERAKEACKQYQLGLTSSQGMYSHTVALYYNATKSWGCGGALISSLFVLTAASCVSNGSKQPNKVTVGETGNNEFFTTSTPYDFDVGEIIIHPLFNPGASKYFDVALIKLASPVQFDPAKAFPACLQTESSFNGDELFATGWIGNGKPSINPVSSAVTLIPNDECSAFWNQQNPETMAYPRGIIESQICASTTGDGVAKCGIDSGSSLVRHEVDSYYVVGVTSSGLFCSGEMPAVYTQVADVAPWIETFVWPES